MVIIYRGSHIEYVISRRPDDRSMEHKKELSLLCKQMHEPI